MLVTLGILTVLSVMAVAFLLTARLQRQTSDSRQNRLVARNYMDEGLYQAVRQIEASLTAPNYTDRAIPAGAYQTTQRMVPVGPWLARNYERALGQDEQVAFQAPDVLASMTLTNAPTVNLLSSQVMRFVPSSLTNGLQLSAKRPMPFRSGWIPTESLTDTASVETQLRSKRGRVAFTIFNCSGFIDANTFASGPTTQKLQRVCFNQADVTNWLAEARNTARFTALNPILGTEDSPFFHLSYDPDPDVYPLHYDCYETSTSVGLNRFGAGPVINLNSPGYYQALGVLKENATYWKFNLNAFKRHLDRAGPTSETPWYNDATFKLEWLDPVVFLLNMMKNEEPATTRYRWADSTALAWTIANFMDEDRVPQVSDFPTAGAPENVLPTRANYAVEDVPLINKVTVFNIYDKDEVIKAPAHVDPDYYGLPASGLSNTYAVAVELWYPFTPKPPPLDSACYVGIYTNAADVTTTTNLPWTQNQMRDWFNWNNVGNSNSVMQALFYAWARAYTNQVGPSIWSHPLWQTVTDQGNLWFTPAMTNHPSWPVADSNGTFSITNTPIWQAFYPATYGEPVTNAAGIVTTNVYTYLVVTHSYVDMVSEPDMQTNRLTRRLGTVAPEPYPILLWSNLVTAVSITNVMGGFVDGDGAMVALISAADTNSVEAIAASPDGVDVVLMTESSQLLTTNRATAFYLADTNNVSQVLTTNLVVSTTELTRVTPLPMPEDLGESLATLFALLPTNSLSALNDFLLLRPDQFTDRDWARLFDSFSQNPAVMSRLFPSHQAPTLGSMTEEDRHALWTVPEPEIVLLDNTKLSANQFQGYFWTVYPKQTVSFMEVTEVKPVEGSGGSASEYQTVTNYYALGKTIPGRDSPNTIWLRPAVTIRQAFKDTTSGETAVNDVIVDEALLSYPGDAAEPVPVHGWLTVTNLCIPEPRNNAYARDWRGFSERWEAVINTTNLNTEVHELPFIQFDTLFSTIGDIGHIYAAYEHRNETEENTPVLRQRQYDTLTFSTRSGAALLDLFTISPTNGPRRGLVQANTQRRPVVQTLLSDVMIGWTNGMDDAESLQPLTAIDGQLNGWADVYADALTNAPYSMGWRSFADMMPNLSTNRVLVQENVWGNTAGLHPMHDYTEDVLRGLIDKVSFRQSIFVIVIAAQALSPASTDKHPIVLADQRAAVTVLRDAYTGKWLVQNWVWLTE